MTASEAKQYIREWKLELPDAVKLQNPGGGGLMYPTYPIESDLWEAIEALLKDARECELDSTEGK